MEWLIKWYNKEKKVYNLAIGNYDYKKTDSMESVQWSL